MFSVVATQEDAAAAIGRMDYVTQECIMSGLYLEGGAKTGVVGTAHMNVWGNRCIVPSY